MTVAVDWLEAPRKMDESARARVSADRKRLREILAKRQQAPAHSSSHSQ
jgi:hypothetical protein